MELPGAFASIKSYATHTNDKLQASNISSEQLAAGFVNQTATSVYSRTGDLSLQMGSGGHVYLRNALSAILATLTTAGQLGLGVTSPSHQLELSTDSGAKPGSSAWTIFSDERLKDILRPYQDGLELLLQIDPIVYSYNGLGGMPKDGKEHIGVTAQALQKVAPYMVGSSQRALTQNGEQQEILTNTGGGTLVYTLINAIKALHGRVAILEAATLPKEIPS